MAGTVGVVNGVAMYTGDGINDGLYYINVGGIDFSNLRAQMKIEAIEGGTNTAGVALRFRRSDENNWWEFGHNDGDTSYVLRKMVAGVPETMAEPGITRAAGDLIRVEAYEEAIACYVNDTLVARVDDFDLKDNTNVGMRFSAGCVDSAVDNFYALLITDDIRTNLTYFMDYEVFVDWDNDGGLTIDDFEFTQNLDDYTTFGSIPPDLEISDTFFRTGTHSLHVTWTNWNLFQFDVAGHGFSQGGFGGNEYGNPTTPFQFDAGSRGFDDGFFAVSHSDTIPTLGDPVYVSPGLSRTLEDLVPGRTYDLNVWVYVPSFSSPITIDILGISGAVTSTLFNRWEKLVFHYEATATEHDLRIYSSEVNPGTPGVHDEAFVDEIQNLGAYEDITCYVIGNRDDITFREGRDQARSLASIAPGDVNLVLDNSTQIFSPDNPGGVLYQYLSPGKPMIIRATYNNQVVNLFQGFVDDYVLNPQREDLSVTMTCMDALQWLANTTLSTAIYPALQTGDAINLVLDAAGWPEAKRDIDQGASTIRWWWEEGTNGLQAVQDLVESEGLPAIAYVDGFGNFVFRGRHHRFQRGRSTGIQATIRNCVEFDEPNFSAPVTYDIGWKDIINQIDVDIDERNPIGYDEVWSTADDELTVISAFETYTLVVKPSDPFYGATTPSVEDGTLVLQTGSGTLNGVSISKDSGQATKLVITAGSTDVTLTKVSLKAFSVPVLRTRKVTDESTTSIAKFGPQANQNSNFPWTNVNDMKSIAQVILGQRADRLAVVYITLNNGHPIRISNIMNRQLSDRIHIVEMMQTFMNDDYYIEVLENSISSGATSHTLSIGCEKARDQLLTDEGEEPESIFTFDVAGQGFDDGFFSGSGSGFTSTDTLFILDSSRLDVDGLGY